MIWTKLWTITLKKEKWKSWNGFAHKINFPDYFHSTESVSQKWQLPHLDTHKLKVSFGEKSLFQNCDCDWTIVKKNWNTVPPCKMWQLNWPKSIKTLSQTLKKSQQNQNKITTYIQNTCLCAKAVVTHFAMQNLYLTLLIFMEDQYQLLTVGPSIVMIFCNLP